MRDSAVPLAAIAGGTDAGIGTTVSVVFQFEGLPALLAALAAGAMTAGHFLVAVSTVRE